MLKSTEFIVENDCASVISVWVEPEAHPVSLFPNGSIVVQGTYRNTPVTVRVWRDGAGLPSVSIWPGDGNTVVKKDNKDVLHLG
jgi:hypothetical protein